MDAIINTIFQLDGQILLFIQDHLRFEFLTPIVLVITKSGDKGALWILISLILLIFKKTRRVGFISLMALAGSLLITNIWLKNYVARIRPYEVIEGLNCLVNKPSEWSFPSGHATAAFASAVAIFKCRPKGIGIPCLIWAFLIAFSRLYVGVHYPLDVICGMIIGTLLGIIMFWIFGGKERRRALDKL